MYKKHLREQIKIQNDEVCFSVPINKENQWVQLAELTPWDRIEDHYINNMSQEEGRGAIPSRVAFGAIQAKEILGCTDAGIVTMITENPFLQYYLGQEGFLNKPMFNASMMSLFRRRFDPEFISQVNEYICTGKWPEDRDEDDPPPPPSDPKEENKGTIILDATVAPADIRYPNDVQLLDECRENVEKLIDVVWMHSDRIGHRTPYNRNKAHRKTTNFIKKKRKTKSQVRAALGDQLEYLWLAIQQLIVLIIFVGISELSEEQLDRFELIKEIYDQQKTMFDNNTNRIEGKILNLRQPHVRAIARNKARSKYEYGQKLALSSVDGYVYIEKQSWENFNEGNTLQQSVFNYYHRFGHFPEAVLADQIYRTKANIKFCQKYGIRLSGPKLGRKTEEQAEQEKEQAYIDSCNRNAIESANGVLKRRYGLDLIMSVGSHNAQVEAYLQVLAMNLQRRLRLLLSIFTKLVLDGTYLEIFRSLALRLAA